MHRNLIGILMVAILLTACQKEKKTTKTDYGKLSSDAALTQSFSSDVFKTVDNESKNGDQSSKVGKTEGVAYPSEVNVCASLTLNTTGGTFPMTLIIDFGNSGCTDNYGVVRKGKLICVYSGHYRTPGATVTVTADNYYVNNHKVEGSKTITNQGRNSANKIVFKVDDSNGKVTKPDGGVCTWNATYTETWLEGESTSLLTSGIAGICDDKYAGEGYIQGVASTGDTYKYQTVTPLIKKVCCHWVQGGLLDIYVNNSKVADVNYGDAGTCDSKVLVTYGGQVYEIYLQ